MELYASIRLRVRCASAIRFPTTMEAMARPAMIGCQTLAAAGNAFHENPHQRGEGRDLYPGGHERR